jgi:FAD/FMN-containing dehydrogenase
MNPTSFTLPSGFLERLRAAFPESALSTESGDLESYGRDWTKVYAPHPSVIAFPGSTEEVARLVKLCADANVPMVPSGGRTGLSGGAVAARGEVVVSLSRMRRMDPVDKLSQTVRVDAGSVTQAVHEYCALQGLTWPIDFASKGSSQVGGNISTNAGGVKVIRYGLTRHWVLGLRVVTADGEILDLNGSLEKNQTGPDLRQLFIGSEGTLGIITEATLKLAPLPGDSEVFFFGLGGVREVLQLFQAARSEKFVINAFEMLGDNCLKAVVQHRGASAPFSDSAPYYVLLEVEKPESENGRQRLENWLASLFDGGGVIDGVLAQNPKEARNLWELREGISESIMSRSLVHKHDISLPISKLQPFIEQFLVKLKETYRGFEIYLFGHIGDGNMHINIRKPEKLTNEEFWKECKSIDQTLFQLVRAHQGSVSAEHGIGLLKKEALHFSRSPSEIAMMRAMKKTLDPKNIFNPGKIFD